MKILFRSAAGVFVGLLFCVAEALAAPHITSQSIFEGSAAGGDALHLYGTDFGTPGSSVVSVTVDGNACTNAQLVAVGEIQCETPTGVPGTSVQAQLIVDGIASDNTMPFNYLQRANIMQVNVVTYDGNGFPLFDPAGSPGGGETLVIRGSWIQEYLHYMPGAQPSSLQVLVGGVECLNPMVVWDGPLMNYVPQGNTVTCTTPAGTPGAPAEIKLFVNGVQDQLSFDGAGYGFLYFQRANIMQVNVVTYDGNGFPLFDPAGSPGGGETLVIRGSWIQEYLHYMPGAQPSSLQVLVGGVECLNPMVVWDGPLMNYVPQGNTVTCTTPAGTPDANAEIELFINGVQDQMSFNGAGYMFHYFPRPSIYQINVAGHDSNNNPIPLPAEGSAAGGEILVIQSSMLWEYLHWMPESQPDSLQVLVGGAACLNPVMIWDGPITDFAPPGYSITCTTPAGTPDANVEIKLFINGVQDQMSFDGAGYMFHYHLRPAIYQLNVVGYDSNNNPIPLPAEGSAAGGETLVIQSSMLWEYLHWMPEAQPDSLQVLVGGAACLNPVMIWDGPITDFAPPGYLITCTTPAGEPNTNAEIKLFVNGVQDQMSFDGVGYMYSYLLAPVLQSITPTQGSNSGGTLVTLMGDNLGNTGAQVNIGGVSCAVQSQTNQQITCITGASSAGIHPTTITIGGQSTNSLPFEYTGALPLNGTFKGMMFRGSMNAQ